jgi:hypothetical protein
MKFETLDEYYDYIEKDNSFLYNTNISNLLIVLRDKVEDNELKRCCSYEAYFNDYLISDKGIKPKFTNTDSTTYPNLDLFDDDLKYIKTRAESVVNPKYKSKYNHLLWVSKQKHYSHARLAIDNYSIFLNSVSSKLSDHSLQQLFEIFYKNLFLLSHSVQYKTDETLQFFTSLIGSNKIHVYRECRLMNFIVENRNRIDKEILKSFYDYANNTIDNSSNSDFIEPFLELQITLCQKMNITPKPSHNQLGEYYITKAGRLNDSFVVHDFYLKALVQFKNANNKEKVEEVTALMAKAKRNINFKTAKFEYTNDFFIKYWDSTAKMIEDLIKNGDSNSVYKHIIHSERILPKASVLKEEFLPDTMKFMNLMNFDINKNISNKKKGIIDPYFLHIQNISLRHLWLLFTKGIKNGKLTFETLIEYLKNNTWYGQNFTHLNADGELEGFDWVELLSPSLFTFFTQSEIDIKQNKNNSTGYILAIDSLVIKFEGLLRELSRCIGAQTIEVKDNETHERISFEKLLENEKLTSLIPEDDIAYFKFLFTNEGMNLRNNIAHCFYKASSYSAGTMILLIAALLRLGNYKNTETKGEN